MKRNVNKTADRFQRASTRSDPPAADSAGVEAGDIDDRLGIQSVETAAIILGAMAQIAGPSALKDVARLSNLSPAKVHRYLVSLVRVGLAVQEDSGSYAIGPQAIALGMAGLRSLAPVKVAPPFLRRLRDMTGETSLLALWSARGPVVIDLEDSGRPIFLNVRPGSLLPIDLTATGHIFAAFLPAESRVNIDGALRSTQGELGRGGARKIAQIKTDGFAMVHDTLVPGASAISAPVFDYRGHLAAVIGIVGRTDDVQGQQATRKAEALKAIAAEFSQRLGGR